MPKPKPKQKHTPAPWRVFHSKIEGTWIDPIGLRVDDVGLPGHREANATLIAMAPELLDQLKYVSVCMRMWLGERATEVCNETDRIIAKAGG